MAKRRKLEAPSAEELGRLEAEFRDETPARAPGRGVAPIAAVAAESAAQGHVEPAEDRAARARDEADADRYRTAQEQGLLVVEIATDQIDQSAMIRDRMVIDQADQDELRNSIATGGLRLPIEVFETGAEDGPRYGLLSGYRRLMAVRSLAEMTGAEKFTTIRAIIRPKAETDSAFVQMVEENEVRADLSNYERGRIAVISAQHGAFANTEEAVNRLFAAGSKAKRSKVRSFALIFEELGDMLHFPESLTETRGLRIASALRMGAEPKLREALSEGRAGDAEEEWAQLDPVLSELEKTPRDTRRGGRPKSKPLAGWIDNQTIRTSSGITIRRGNDSKGHILRFEGRAMDSELMDSLMVEIQNLLERP